MARWLDRRPPSPPADSSPPQSTPSNHSQSAPTSSADSNPESASPAQTPPPHPQKTLQTPTAPATDPAYASHPALTRVPIAAAPNPESSPYKVTRPHTPKRKRTPYISPRNGTANDAAQGSLAFCRAFATSIAPSQPLSTNANFCRRLNRCTRFSRENASPIAS